jgi:hypothetical protein
MPGKKLLYGTEMTERLYVRVTPEQKVKWQVVPEYTMLTSSEFWRTLLFEVIVGRVVNYLEGDITPEEFEMAVGSEVRQYIDEIRTGYEDEGT